MALLLALNLTVAVGTLNGVIFYANIVASNFSTFFPFSSPNFVTVSIAWLNLDIGIDTCFFEGMNAYWKLWIDVLFPAYMIFLVVMIIFISERSTMQICPDDWKKKSSSDSSNYYLAIVHKITADHHFILFFCFIEVS